ncbi:hypothetical protein OUZ56_029646 [Daphnia magna]|uniref:Uncharacterized protein n=1 Tax=Daphnia magna TaxID=35525 RepID=A0ABR0B7F1_9CRUS|nr:hypothetical protein OUZ56_029646 [Daphnia magna]
MEQLTIEDFYKLWTLCKMEVEEIHTIPDARVKAKAYLVNLLQTVHKMMLDRESNNNSFPHGQVESFIGPLDKFKSDLRERENSIVSPTFTIQNKRIDHLLENFEEKSTGVVE